MANTISSILPTILAASTKVAREAVGLIPSVTLNAAAGRVAKGQVIKSHVSPRRTADDITPGASVPAPTNATYTTRDFQITKSRYVDVTWSGREIVSVDTFGRPINAILRDDFAQAFRTLTNEIEGDLAAELAAKAGGAIGTSGTAPYGSDLGAAASAERILNEMGAPGDRYMVLDATALVNLRALATLQAGAESVQEFVQQGTLISIAGLAQRYSPKIISHTAGLGASYQTNNANGYAIGDVDIAIDTGTGTVKAGDVVTFAGDSNQYVVTKGVTSPGTITIQDPGLKLPLADNVAMTITSSYTANLAFSRSAVELATGLPEAPPQGDLATDSMAIKDPHSGLVFEVRYYPGYRQGSFQIGLNWGVNVAMPEWVAIVKG